MSIRVIHTENAPKAIGPYSQATAFENLIFCAGQIPLIPTTMQLLDGDIVTQTTLALENLSHVLTAAGSDMQHVVKTTVFLKNFQDFPKMNAVYESAFGNHKPARSTVEVVRLPRDALVEIECIAIRKS